jgi:hypothetical protein
MPSHGSSGRWRFEKPVRFYEGALAVSRAYTFRGQLGVWAGTCTIGYKRIRFIFHILGELSGPSDQRTSTSYIGCQGSIT